MEKVDFSKYPVPSNYNFLYLFKLGISLTYGFDVFTIQTFPKSKKDPPNKPFPKNFKGFMRKGWETKLIDSCPYLFNNLTIYENELFAPLNIKYFVDEFKIEPDQHPFFSAILDYRSKIPSIQSIQKTIIDNDFEWLNLQLTIIFVRVLFMPAMLFISPDGRVNLFLSNGNYYLMTIKNGLTNLYPLFENNKLTIIATFYTRELSKIENNGQKIDLDEKLHPIFDPKSHYIHIEKYFIQSQYNDETSFHHRMLEMIENPYVFYKNLFKDTNNTDLDISIHLATLYFSWQNEFLNAFQNSPMKKETKLTAVEIQRNNYIYTDFIFFLKIFYDILSAYKNGNEKQMTSLINMSIPYYPCLFTFIKIEFLNLLFVIGSDSSLSPKMRETVFLHLAFLYGNRVKSQTKSLTMAMFNFNIYHNQESMKFLPFAQTFDELVQWYKTTKQSQIKIDDEFKEFSQKIDLEKTNDILKDSFPAMVFNVTPIVP